MRYLLALLLLLTWPALADPSVTPVQIGNQTLLAQVDQSSQLSSLPADSIAQLPSSAYVWCPGTVQVWWREYDPNLTSAGGPMWMPALPQQEMKIWDHPYVVVKYLYLDDGQALVDVPFEVTAPGTRVVLGQNILRQAPEASFMK
ncbi:MAG: hypothetical protein ACYCW6_25755 [Candidatus Xenobia bacterium]